MPAKTIDPLPEPRKDPPKPAPRVTPAAPAITEPASAVGPTATAPSNGVAAHAAHKAAAAADASVAPHSTAKDAPATRHSPVPRPGGVIDLQGATQFMPGGWAEYIQACHGKAADVDVKWGALAPTTAIKIQWDSHAKAYSTPHHQPLLIVQPFFTGLPDKLAPALFVKIDKGQITGFAAPHTEPNATALAHQLGNSDHLKALGLPNFRLSSPKFNNEVRDGHFVFGTDAQLFKIAGWLAGSLKLGLIDEKVAFDASAQLAVRGIANVAFHITRDKDGHYTGELQIPVTLRGVSGNVLARYVNGDISITGTIGYASEKLSGSLTVMFGNVDEVHKAARGLLDPGKLLGEEAVKDDSKAEKGKPGEKGIGAWGQFAFTFTDWMTGTVLGILDPFGHVTTVGKIAPPKEIVLLKAPPPVQRDIPPFPLGTSARYGLPYVADVHIGFKFDLGFLAWIGPAVLTDIVVEGQYSTDPTVSKDFSLSGAFRISAYAGLRLSFSVFAGATILGHDIDAGGTLTGSAGIKAYAEARPKIGYRETADHLTGKKGEAYLQGHLEAAAQPVLGLAGELWIKLTTPWWSPVSDHTWPFPLFNYEWPLASALGVAADIDYVIGSDKLPDVKFGQVDFDASKFSDAILHDNVPAGKGSGEPEKAGSWKGVEPKPSSTPATAPPKGPAPPGGGKAQAGTPSPSSGKSRGQTPDEARNVPKDPEVAKRWLNGLKALADLHDRAEKDPENVTEIGHHLADIKRQYNFSKLDPVRRGNVWVIGAAMNPVVNPDDPAAIRVRGSFSDADVQPLLPNEGLVKPYGQLPKPPNDDLTGHHMPQDKFMEAKARELALKYDRNEGYAFNMFHPFPEKKSQAGRHQRTRSFKRAPDLGETPKQSLERDLADVEAIYKADQARLPPNADPIYSSKIQAALREIEQLNLTGTYKEFFDDKVNKSK